MGKVVAKSFISVKDFNDWLENNSITKEQILFVNSHINNVIIDDEPSNVNSLNIIIVAELPIVND